MLLALLALPIADDSVFQAMDSCFVVAAGDSVGAGFMVQGDLVVTAAHVVGDRARVILSTGEVHSRRFTGTVVFADPREDVALIQPNAATGVPTLPLATREPIPGDLVYTVGSPIERLIASRGEIVAVDAGRIESTTPVDHGNSGGPLLSEDGMVLGVVVESSGINGNAFSVPVSIVREALSADRSTVMPTESVPMRRTGADLAVALSSIVGFLLLTTVFVLAILWSRHRRRERRRIVITLERN